MRRIEDMQYTTESIEDGRWVGRVDEFPKLRTRPYRNRLDAIDEIVRLTARRLREAHASMDKAAER